MGPSDARFLSRPCEVHFAGFVSDTYRLQQEGWQLSMEQDIRMRSIRLAMRLDAARLYMVSNACTYEYMSDYGRDRLPVFHVQHCASNVTVQLMESQFLFKPIDATPQYTEVRRRSIEDFGIFAAPAARTEEIIVEPETVASLLDKIKSMQSPELAAIRERNRRRAADPGSMDHGAMQGTRFHAQIVTLAA